MLRPVVIPWDTGVHTMIVDLVLKNGKIWTTGGILEGGVGIDSGKIVTIGKDEALPNSDKTIDLKGKLILPGFIDAHTHIRGMDRSDWEDFTSGTSAAAAGAITTVFEMPITVPPTSTVTGFREKVYRASRESIVNFAFYAGAGGQNIDEIPLLAREGALAFKTFMHPPPAGREEDFWGFYVTDDVSHFKVLESIAETGLVSAVHAENYAVIAHLTERLKTQGRRDLTAYMESRPGITEADAIFGTSMLASYVGARLHICHIAASQSVAVVEMLKKNGQMVTAETCPHYLTFTHKDVERLGPYAKINPPVRQAADREMLWKALNSGVIDIVASDHGAFPKDTKEVGRSDIWQAYMGAPGLDCMMPVMFTHVNQGRISLGTLVRVCSENPARIFGLYPRKGVLAIGSDADIVAVDLSQKRKLKASEFYTKAKDVSLLYDGFEAKGIPTLTIVNGLEVMRDGEITGRPGTGKLEKPSVAN